MSPAPHSRGAPVSRTPATPPPSAPEPRGEFSGLRALVTGGASAIGAATASALQGRVAQVSVLDLQPDGSPDGSLALRCDVADSAGVDEAVAEAAARLGGLHIVINNAGIGA